VIGGDVCDRSTAMLRPGGTLVTIVGPPERQPADGRITASIAAEHPLRETISAFGPDALRLPGKTIIRVAEEV
jgi:hypothetical protein